MRNHRGTRSSLGHQSLRIHAIIPAQIGSRLEVEGGSDLVAFEGKMEPNRIQ
ncbi:hypothetical protein RISK_000091 [Rhodopirellula islandica]|uniref:Uncharacterized protein n=1 Tax=Rhodopirellula islandica TaxID=595434 RepID=A0A0J1BN64_RHOIS|nr:hypothetical protein RISK_000091 [Rhodopirellula islandica]